MSNEDLIRPGQIAFHLELTAAQLKIVHTALKTLYDDLGHEEYLVKRVVSEVLAKLPGEHDMRGDRPGPGAAGLLLSTVGGSWQAVACRKLASSR